MLSSYPAMPFPHEHDYLARTLPELERDASPSAKSTESGDPCQTPSLSESPLPTPLSVYSMKSCFSIPSCPSSKSVTFSSLPPSIYEAPSNSEYDRTPHAVVPRLTYRDVLEMREVLQMTVELGIFAKRSSSGTSSSDSTTLPTVQATQGGPLGSNFPFPRPAAQASEFPTSSKLVQNLNDIPLCPPTPAQGMGMTVMNGGEGLDGVANWRPKRSSSPALASALDEEEESEFAKEVREAREQLALLEVAKMRERERGDLERVKASLMTFAGPGPMESRSAGPSRKSSIDDLSASSHSQNQSRSALFFGTAWSNITTGGSGSGCSPSNSRTSSSNSSPLRPPPSLAPRKRTLSPPISPRRGIGALHSPLPEREPSPHPHSRGSFFPDATPRSPPTLLETVVERRRDLATTSPILAPFARSSPTPLATATVDGSRNVPTPPSPILAPFARSAKLV